MRTALATFAVVYVLASLHQLNHRITGLRDELRMHVLEEARPAPSITLHGYRVPEWDV